MGEKHEREGGAAKGRKFRRSDVSSSYVGAKADFSNFGRRPGVRPPAEPLRPPPPTATRYRTPIRPTVSECISVNHIALSGPWTIRCITVLRVGTG